MMEELTTTHHGEADLCYLEMSLLFIIFALFIISLRLKILFVENEFESVYHLSPVG